MSCKPANEPISDVDRILLFEWHAAHLESWHETEFPSQHSHNLQTGMDASTFHKLSITLALLRKFYTQGHEVLIGSVIDSVLRQLSPNQRALKTRLKQEQSRYRDYVRMPGTVTASDENAPEQIMFDITYGLLIHSDPDRQAKLLKMSRGWMHNIIALNNAHRPVIELLATIRRAREDGTLVLPDPHESIWEPSSPTRLKAEQVDRVLGMTRSLTAPSHPGETPSR